MKAHIFLSLLLVSSMVLAESPGWRRAKNTDDDVIYSGKDRTFYCGCVYTSHGDNDGSGSVDYAACGYIPPTSYIARATRVEWEHVVPASLMPARQFDCWVLDGRENCEREDPRAQGMLFDLHNLAPSVGQVNALRSNDRYAELPDNPTQFGTCPAVDTSGAFEPPDCLKRGRGSDMALHELSPWRRNPSGRAGHVRPVVGRRSGLALGETTRSAYFRLHVRSQSIRARRDR